MNTLKYFLILLALLAACKGRTTPPVEAIAEPEWPLKPLQKLFVVGDFDGDGKQDTLFQGNFSKHCNAEIEMAPDPNETDWDDLWAWFNHEDNDVYLYLNKSGADTLHLGNAYGLYCLINLGDLNADGHDEIALVRDVFDQSALNSCLIYSLCNGRWTLLKKFGVHESAFWTAVQDSISVYTAINGYLEKRKGKWMYFDYSEYLENLDTITMEEGKMKPLKIEKCK